MSNLDGLAMLGQQRAKASRRVGGGVGSGPQSGSVRRTLPPRHPAPAKEPTPSTREAGPQGSDAPSNPPQGSSSANKASRGVTGPSTSPPVTKTPQETPSSGTPKVPRIVDQPLIRSTLYVDADLDAWLQTVSGLGRSATPRADITRSAVVRFAVERLRAEMSAGEVFDALVSRAADATSSGGRKRI